MMPNVAVDCLKMLVDPADSSYMPTLVVVRWGNSPSKLCQVNTVSIKPTDTWVVLLRGIKEVRYFEFSERKNYHFFLLVCEIY